MRPGAGVSLLCGLVATLLAGCSSGPEDPADLQAHLQRTLPHDSAVDPALVTVRIVDGDVELRVGGRLSDADAVTVCRDAADWLYTGKPENGDDDILVTDAQGRLLALRLAARDECGPPEH